MGITTRFIRSIIILLIMKKHKTAWLIFTFIISSCQPVKETTQGSIERSDPTLDQIISPNAHVEVIAKGYDWSEGPVWVKDKKMLLFSDVPKNSIYKWTEEKGAELYLTPSGYTGHVPRGGEPGSNGLLISAKEQLVLCQHGDRRIALMNAGLDYPSADFTTLADNYHGKKFNSPNDAVFDSKGNLYVTDPPYGLLKLEKDPAKETPFQGVYKVYPNGKVTLLTDTLTRPNGIAISPDEKFLVISNSDPAKARWYRYELKDSSIISGKIFYDATASLATEKGLPDGLKIDSHGTLFATGPGGMFIFNPEGKVLGKIKLPQHASNCALGEDEKTLYVTSDMYLLRLKMR